MGKSFIALLLCAACAAHGQQLLVEYQGTVSSIDRASSLAETPPYAIGDAIGGTLIIETALAPVDQLGGDSHIGRYYGGTSGADFILGPPSRVAGRSAADLLLVRNDWAPRAGAALEDGLIIRDRSTGTDGSYDLLLGLQRPNLLGQLFHNDSLTQSFEVEAEPGTNLWGYIERGFGELWRAVHFTLDKFSVTPGVCRAPS